MKFTELDPHWLSDGARGGIGLSFGCPCGCDQRIVVGLSNPRDGGAPVVLTKSKEGHPTWWKVTNPDDFTKLSLTPSIIIWRENQEHWHGHITSGEVIP